MGGGQAKGTRHLNLTHHAIRHLPQLMWVVNLTQMSGVCAASAADAAFDETDVLSADATYVLSAAKAVDGGFVQQHLSSLVLGTGLFILIFPFASPVALALPITGLVNAVMSLPFVLRALVPAVAEVEGRFGGLADSLGMTGWARFRGLYLPRLRRPLGFSAGLAAALSMGDLGVIALFSDPEAVTLPLRMYQLMAAYRMEEAAGAALLLLAASLSLFWVFDRGGRVDADS